VASPVTTDLQISPLTPTVAIWVQYGYKASCARPSYSFVIFDILALRRSGLRVTVPGCQKIQWRLNPVWHWMLYSCTVWQKWASEGYYRSWSDVRNRTAHAFGLSAMARFLVTLLCVAVIGQVWRRAIATGRSGTASSTSHRLERPVTVDPCPSRTASTTVLRPATVSPLTYKSTSSLLAAGRTTAPQAWSIQTRSSCREPTSTALRLDVPVSPLVRV